MDALTQWILHAAASPWALLAVFVFTVVDSVFPPVPSESLAIGLAAAGIATGDPPVWVVALVAAAGAFVGDNIAYTAGRTIGLDRFAWMHKPWFARPMARASAELGNRISTAIIAGRFIPVGRIGINLVAGASGVPPRVFRPLAALACSVWAVYSVVLGSLAGGWFAGNPVWGIGLAIAIGIGLGLMLDTVITLYRRRRRRAASAASTPATPSQTSRQHSGEDRISTGE